MGMELRSERLHRAAVEDKAEKDRREMVRKEVERIDSLMTISKKESCIYLNFICLTIMQI